MILINKKRLGIILSCIFVGLFAFSFKIASEKNISNTNVEDNKILETAATPVSGKTIVVGYEVPDEHILSLTLNK